MVPSVTITTAELGKEYNYRTVFEGVSLAFGGVQAVAILGDNGSGKSTFLKILSGMAGATSGKVKWEENKKALPSHLWFEKLTYCSPHLEFDFRFTVRETLEMFVGVKPFPAHLSVDEMISMMKFENHAYKKMNELSSGMYQRVRLILTICADVPVLFLDEPCSNLDHAGVAWYNELVRSYAKEKLVFVASNDPREYEFCTDSIDIMDYKKGSGVLQPPNQSI